MLKIGMLVVIYIIFNIYIYIHLLFSNIQQHTHNQFQLLVHF